MTDEIRDDEGAPSPSRTVKDWVFVEPRQRLTFDAETISSHGKTHLSRALESRKIVAVLGSGLSRGYGQPSWPALLRNTAALVQAEIDAWKSAQKDAREKGFVPRKNALLDVLIKRFEDAGLVRELQSTENVTVHFELCDNLYAELHTLKLQRQEIEVRSRSDEIFKARAYLRSRLKWQLQDNRGRIEILLSDEDIKASIDSADPDAASEAAPLTAGGFFKDLTRRLSYPGRPGDSTVLQKDADYAALFALFFYKDVRHTEKLVEQVAERPEGFADARKLKGCIAELKQLRRFSSGFFTSAFRTPAAPDGDEEAELPDPIVRFIHLFDVAEDPTQRAHWDAHWAIDAAFANMSAVDKLRYLHGVHCLSEALAGVPGLARTLQDSARARLPDFLDPVAILHKDLGVRRFVTMNYDAEVDKWLEALGYEEIAVRKDQDILAAEHGTAPPSRASRSILVDRFNTHAEILAYEPGSAPDLFAFGVDTRDKDLRVLHMHGRIRKAESWLVLSEADYQARYARDDDPKAQCDDAMRLVFNANPLLFIGLGMSEADVLKPLRTYLQTEVTLSDRPSVALLPRLKGGMETALAQSKAMSAYGIFNLYYGEANSSLDAASEGGDTSSTDDPDSLKKLVDAALAFQDVLKGIRDYQGAAGKFASAAFDTLEVAHEKALAALRVVKTDGFSYDVTGKIVRRFATVERSSVHALIVNHATHQLLRLADAVFGADMRNDTARITRCEGRDRLALQYLVEGALNTIMTAFFCARLKHVVDDHRDWLAGWGHPSNPREPYGRSPRAEVDERHPLLDTFGDAIDSVRQVVILRDLEAERKADIDASKPSTAESDDVAPAVVAPVDDEGVVLATPSLTRRFAAPRTDRFFAGQPSPAIITLRAAFRGLPDKHPDSKRLFLLLGERGDGRGHIFAAMRSPKRFAHICDWLRLPKPQGQDNRDISDWSAEKREAIEETRARLRTRRIPRAFYNLGLSHEVLSVFDRLMQFLQDILYHNLGPEARAAFKSGMDAIESDRVHRFSVIMEALNAKAKLDHTDRIVIVINNVDKLFNDAGAPKNAQIAKIVDILFKNNYPAAPIDFIFYMNHSPLPQVLQDLSNATPFFALCSDAVNPVYVKAYEAFMDGLGVSWGNPRLRPAPDGLDAAFVYIHRLHPMRPITFALRFFPKVAFALYHLGLKIGDDGHRNLSAEASRVNYTFNDDIQIIKQVGDEGLKQRLFDDQMTQFALTKHMYFQKSIRDAFDGILKSDGAFSDDAHSISAKFVGDFIDDIALNLIQYHLDRVPVLIKEQAEIQSLEIQAKAPIDINTRKKLVNDRHEKVNGYEENNTKVMRGLIGAMLGAPGNQGDAAFKTLAKSQRDRGAYYFEKLYGAVAQNRFCLTLVMAAIDDMIERRLNSYPQGMVELIPVMRFMERLTMASASLSEAARAETAVALVILNYKTDAVNSYATPMSAWPQAFWDDIERGDRYKISTDVLAAMFKTEHSVLAAVQEAILAALSLIGQPVSPSTLLGVESVAAACTQLFRAIKAELSGRPFGNEEKQRCVDIIMDLLVHRCLVFRLYPKNDALGQDYHFTVHSIIRRYYLSNMNAHNVDYATIDQLTVSIYSSQPNDMPKPSAETNRRIRRLIEGLAVYEDRSRDAFDDPYLDGKIDDRAREDIVRSRLRAAFGALRSFYSVAVVSRFSSFQDEGIFPPELGYFEVHRRRVRWLLRKAYELDNVRPRAALAPQQEPLYTFYAEEQVWMYNECGVVSLAQGRVGDAVGLFIQAKRVVRKYIESHGSGALHAAIDLNLAVAKIDAGSLREARELLRGVPNDPAEPPTVKALARGYLAWIQGLQGDLAHAETRLAAAIEALTREEMFRAAAILLIHRADILTQIGRARYDEAETALMSARSLSSNGGHEDVRQLSLLAYYKLLAARFAHTRDRQTKDLVLRGLGPLKDYAETMNMPRIACGVALVEAQLFFNEREYMAASDAAQRALLTATRHALELAKIDAMHILGAALFSGGTEEARELLIRARELAIHSEYNAKINALELALSRLPPEGGAIV